MLSYCNLPGVTCTAPEPWTFFACILIIWAMLLSLVGISVETYRHRIYEMPTGLQVLGGVALLSFHPYALAVQFGLWMSFYGVAPLGGGIVTTLFGLFGIWAFWYFTIGPDFWKMVRHQ